MPPEQENYPQVPLNELDMEGCLGHMYNNYLRRSEVVKVTLIINTQSLSCILTNQIQTTAWGFLEGKIYLFKCTFARAVKKLRSIFTLHVVTRGNLVRGVSSFCLG